MITRLRHSLMYMYMYHEVLLMRNPKCLFEILMTTCMSLLAATFLDVFDILEGDIVYKVRVDVENINRDVYRFIEGGLYIFKVLWNMERCLIKVLSLSGLNFFLIFRFRRVGVWDLYVLGQLISLQRNLLRGDSGFVKI